MAVVRNLMIRIGADYSAARKGMQGATRELNRFKTDTIRTTKTITGSKGLGGIGAEFRTLGKTVTSSFSQLRGAKGLGGVTSAIGSLRPVLGAATSGLRGLAVAAGGASAALGPIGIGIGAITAALALLSAGLYSASQTAAKFEADIGRLNITLREGARGYMDWARAQGLAKQSAAELGATYGNLLASFISDTKQLQESTQDLVHATRVIASYTGRDIDDVFNRIRSGMLGSTEAIEDLGVYVNISMIESTEAFRKFAGDKSWSQLTFQQQQQIRLAAILEQTYKRYGNDLQQNVMTKQERLLEQFKDVKLHLSQMFLPLWDAVLPALTRFGESLAWVTEQLARFFYAIRGWDYDEMTRGANRATDAINDQGDAYDELAESAKKAVKQLAAFDEINQLGDFGDGSKGGAGSSGGGGFPTPPGTPSRGVTWDWPEVPPALTKRYRIEFDPPRPPDAGMGAVATAVISTVDAMNAETKSKIAQMWGDLHGQTQVGVTAQLAEWSSLSAGVSQGIIPSMVQSVRNWWTSLWEGLRAQTGAGIAEQQSALQGWSSFIGQALMSALTSAVVLNWSNMWASMFEQTATGSLGIREQMGAMNAELRADSAAATQEIETSWRTMLANMLAALKQHRPLIEVEWAGLKETLQSITEPLDIVNANWRTTLAEMLAELNLHRPLFAAGFAGVGVSMLSLIPQLESTRQAWSDALANMKARAFEHLNPIIAKINETITLWMAMQSMMGAMVPDIGSAMQTAGEKVKNALSAVNKEINAFLDAGANVLTFGLHNKLLAATGNQDLVDAQKGAAGTAGTVVGSLVGGAGIAKGIGRYADDILEWLSKVFRGGAAVPAFATGGIVYGPTLAMIGEAGKEAVIPLENTSFVDTLASAIGTAVVQAQQAAQSGQESDREIVIQIDGTTLARVMYPYQQQEQQRRGTAAIRAL